MESKITLNAKTRDIIVTSSSDGTLSSNSDTLVPSEKAIKTYVDTKSAGSITGSNATLTLKSVGESTLSTVTVNNVASSTKATQDANSNTITTYYLNTSNTAQTKTGDLTLKGNLYAGEAFPFNGDGSTIYRTKNIVNNGRTALYSGFYSMSSQMDRLYGLVYNSTWKCTCNYKGDGSAQGSGYIAYGGTQTAGGAKPSKGSGNNGTFGLGGNASGANGGAGGAGWYGGGGADGGSATIRRGSGGGGSSYTDSSCNKVVHTQGYNAGTGYIIITYIMSGTSSDYDYFIDTYTYKIIKNTVNNTDVYYAVKNFKKGEYFGSA